MTPVPRIGIDAMGGDFGPGPVAEGAALALREWPGRFRLTLVGDEAEIRAAVVRDVGANAEVKGPWLVQFAHMGACFARYLLGHENPRVGLLSIGEEESKGNQLVQEVLPLLKAARHLNFIGPVEGRDLFKGTCDVMVTDGFTGNVLLKTAESAASFLGRSVREEVKRDPLAMFGALFMRGALGRLRSRIDW